MPRREKEKVIIPSEVSDLYINQSGTDSYINYAYSLAFFIIKLYREVKEEKIQKVFFLAREGEFLKKLFDAFVDTFHLNENLSSEYLYVSRQSTFAASLSEKIENESFSRLFKQYHAMSIRAFLKNLTFDENDIEFLQREIPYDFDYIVDEFQSSPEYTSLRNNNLFIDIYQQRIEECKQQLIEYLSMNGLYTQTHIAIVDVGWKGSIQDNIYLAGLKDSIIYGYYLGLEGDVWTDINNRKKGLLYANYPLKSKFYNIFEFDSHFYERILTASHPSTRGYSRKNGKIIPVFNEHRKEKENYMLVKDLQDKIYNQVLRICKSYIDNALSLHEIEVITAKYHVLTVTNVNSSNMRFQACLLKGQEENFGNQMSNEVLLKKQFSIKATVKKVKKIFSIKKEPILLAHYLWHLKLYALSAAVFRKQRTLLNKEINNII